MDGTFDKIRNIFEACDFFPSPILLRYRTEEKKAKCNGRLCIAYTNDIIVSNFLYILSRGADKKVDPI